MNDETKLKTIAELDGWIDLEIVGKSLYGHKPNPKGWMTMNLLAVPKYLNSRDAIISAIEAFCGTDNERWLNFSNKLAEVLQLDMEGRRIYLVRWSSCASAEKLSEALLRAAGKWQE